MEPIPEHPPSVSASRVPPDHRLPSGRNKIERIAQHSRGLVDDLKSWVELKIQHTKLQIKEELEERRIDLTLLAGAGFFALLGFLFGLVALALGLGAWLGHPGWGFLVVTGLLFVVAVIFLAARRARARKLREIDVTPGGRA